MGIIAEFLSNPSTVENLLTLAVTAFPFIEWDIYNNDGYFTNTTLKEFNLIKENPNCEIDFISWPPQVVSRYNDINYDAIATNGLFEETKKFIDILVNQFPRENLKMFYNNINELKINDNSISYNRKIQLLKNILLCMRYDDYTAASYNPSRNRIKLSKDNIRSLPHELFHMASSYNDREKGIIFCGFDQQHIKNHHKCIGTGVNEGYTECMVWKYYGYDYISGSMRYSLLRIIMDMMQKIIGNEKMEEFYLTADLDGLVKEIAKYDNYDNAQEFVSAMDFLYHYSNSKFVKSEENKKLYTNNLDFIHKLLLRMNIKKIKDEYDNWDISEEDFINRLTPGFIEDIPVFLNCEMITSRIDFSDYCKMAEDAIKDTKKNY